jgi:phosphoglycolate phosphatase
MPKLIERIRAAAFDLDGTLIDTAPDLATAVNVMLTMLGANALSESRVRALIGNGVDRLVLEALTESLGGPPPYAAQRSAALSLFGRLYGQRLFERSRIYPGVARALRALAEAGITLCCVTNKDSKFAVPLLEAARLREFLAFTLCPNRAEDRKPSPNLLLSACSRLGISPSEMLYVGDSRTDIVAARAAGCRVVVVNYGYNRGLPLEAVNPDGIIASMTEIVTMYVRPLVARANRGFSLSSVRTGVRL